MGTLVRRSGSAVAGFFVTMAPLFAAPQDFPGYRPPIGSKPQDVALGDFNGDGLLDAVTANLGSPSFATALFGTAEGSFERIVPLLPTAEVATAAPTTVTGDWNGDGIADAAVAIPGHIVGNGTPHLIELLVGNMGSGLTSLSSWTIAELPVAMAARDFDGDGLDDLVVATELGVHLWRSLGSETFVESILYMSAEPIRDVAALDWNLDAFSDVAITAGESVVTLAGFGDGTFGPPDAFGFDEYMGETGSTLKLPAITSSDVNGDGKFDLAVNMILVRTVPVAYEEYIEYIQITQESVALVLGDGSGGVMTTMYHLFESYSWLVDNAPQGSSSIVTIDVDGDGVSDVAARSLFGDSVYLLPMSSWGNYGIWLLAGVNPWALVAGPLGFDDSADLVVCNAGSNDLSTFLGGPDGRLQLPVQSCEWLHFVEAASIGDFNGDGRSDIATQERDQLFPTGGGYSKGCVSFDLTTVNGSFVHKIAPTGIIVEALQAADFNSDGRDDVVCSGPLSVQTSFPPELRIFLSNAFGGVFLQTWVSLKGEIESLATSDVNLDGVVDVVTAGETPGYLGIYIGNGAGGLGAPADFAMASTYYPSIAVGDVNGDAMPDVVSVTRGWSAAGGGIMAVNFGLGGGLFSSPVRIGGSEPQGYGALSLGDLTSDGLTDIAVTTSSTLESGGEIRVVVFGALQGGQTEVVGSAESSSGLHPRSLALGDYDGDGDLDIAAAAETIHGVDVFLGVGDGSLEKRRVYAGGAGPRWVATADLNGNGLLDLAVAGWGSAVSTLLR